MIEALGNIELASRVIDTKSADFETHPVDARCAQLQSALNHVHPSPFTPLSSTPSLHTLPFIHFTSPT